MGILKLKDKMFKNSLDEFNNIMDKMESVNFKTDQ